MNEDKYIHNSNNENQEINSNSNSNQSINNDDYIRKETNNRLLTKAQQEPLSKNMTNLAKIDLIDSNIRLNKEKVDLIQEIGDFKDNYQIPREKKRNA